MMEIFRRFTFEAAHRLPKVPSDHKCAQIHGHSYKVSIHLMGEVGETSGWVMDFGEIRAAFRPIVEQLDHHLLNDIEGLENPTAENLSRWIWERLDLPGLSEVTVWETGSAGCTYRRVE